MDTNNEKSPVNTTQATQEATDKLKDLYKRKSQSAKDMFKSMQSYLSDFVSDKTEEQKPVWTMVKESIKIDGVSNIPRNLALLFKTYKFGPLSGFNRMYIVLLIDLIISSLIFGGLNSFFYTGLKTLFGLCAPFVTTLLVMMILYVPLTGLVNNLIALFRSYFFLHYNLDENHSLIDELKVANNKLLKRIDPYYRLDPYNLDESVIVVSDKDAKKKTISEEYRGYIDYENEEPKKAANGMSIPYFDEEFREEDLLHYENKEQKIGEDALAWGKQYVSDNKEQEAMRGKNIAPDANPLDWAKGYISEQQEQDTSTDKDMYVPKAKEDLNVLELMNETPDRNLDDALNKISDYSSDSDKEIFDGVDLEELQEIKDDCANGRHPLKGKLDIHKVKAQRTLREKTKGVIDDPTAVETHAGFLGE